MAQNHHSADHSTFISLWEEYTGSTGLHAVNKIQPRGKQSYYRTVFWSILWMCSAGYVLSLVSLELWDYYQYPTVTFVSERIANELVFPAITICNLSPRNRSKFNDDPRTDNYHIGISELFHFKLNISINWSDPFYVAEGYFKNRTLDDLYSESKNMNVFLAQYRFDLQPEKIEFVTVETELGVCIRGNSERPISTKLYGGLYNLHAYLDLALEDDYYSNSYMSSGIKVAVHDRNEEVSMVHEGFVIPPATEAFVQISKVEYSYLPEPYKAFESDACVQKDSRYSKLACDTYCLRQVLVKMCNCVDFRFRHYENDNATFCSKERYKECYLPALWYARRNASYSCNCPVKCKFTKYETSLSFGDFPSTFMTKQMTGFLDSTEEYIRKNFLSLRIYYKDLNTKVIHQIPKYLNVGDVFSNLGGQMGLFLGASILTITELGEFLVFLIWYFCIRLSRRYVD